jgi:hypothetical protein
MNQKILANTLITNKSIKQYKENVKNMLQEKKGPM